MSKQGTRRPRSRSWGDEEASDRASAQDALIEREGRLLDLFGAGMGITVGALGVFELPYIFPPQEQTAGSQSYVVGFNNRVAMLAALVTVGFFCLRRLWWRKEGSEPVETLIVGRQQGRFRPSMPKTLLLLLIALHVIQASFFYVCSPAVDAFGEPIVLMPRIMLGLKHHLLPFCDISWPYGLGLYYLPQAFILLVSHFEGTPDLGYFLCYLSLVALGHWAVFYVVDALRVKVAARMVIFCSLILSFDTISMGVQYTMLRFALPFASALLVHRIVVHAPAGGERWSLGWACVVAMVGTLAVAAVSCEVGIAYTIGQAAYFLHRALFFRRAWFAGAVATVVAAAVVLVGFPGSLVSLSGFSKGAFNFPVLLSVHIVLYLLSLLWVLPMVARACWTFQPGENVSLLLAWSGMIVALLPGALGRCDIGHISFYGLGVFLLTMGALARFQSRLLPAYVIAYFAVFGLAARIGAYMGSAATRQMDGIFATMSGERVERSVGASPLVAQMKLDNYRTVAAPLGCDMAVKKYLDDSRRAAVMYHPDMVTVRTVADVEREIEDLQKADAVLAPAWVLNFKDMSEKAYFELLMANRRGFTPADHLFMAAIFLRPVKLRPLRPPLDPHTLVARHLADRFVVLEKDKDYVLLAYRRTTDSHASTSSAVPTSVRP